MQSTEPIQTKKFDFYTEYSQFYIADNLSKTFANWNTSELDNRFLNREDFIAIGTGSYGQIKGEVNIFEESQHVDDIKLGISDHVIQIFVRISSQSLRIMSCTSLETELELPIKNGIYKVVVYSQNLGSVIGDQGDDYYYIDLSPLLHDSLAESRVLKRYKSE